MPQPNTPVEDFYNLIQNLDRSAFRLETLPQYLVEPEREEFAAFLAGQPLPPPRTGAQKEWDDIIRRNRAAGKPMQRIHVLPERLTPYLRYEIEWAYAYTATAGEQIHFLLADAPKDLLSRATQDFWLIDDRVSFLVRYDQEGRFLGMDREDRLDVVAGYVKLREDLLSRSISLNQYLASTRTA